MKLSSAILALSLLAVSASNEQEHGTALRGGVVDEVLHVVRDLGKNKKGGRTVDDEKKVAEDVEGTKVKADKKQKAQKQKDQKQKNKAGNKAGGGNRNPGDCNVNGKNLSEEQIKQICQNRAGGTTINNRMDQCDATAVIPAMVIDKRASVQGGSVEIVPGTECDDDDDDKCIGCCCGGGYFGVFSPNHPTKAGQWKRACVVTSSYAAPVGLCRNPEGVPVDVGPGNGGLGP